MQSGMEVAIITAKSSPIFPSRQSPGIIHTYLGVEDKLSTLKDLCEKIRFIFVTGGVSDDINDLAVRLLVALWVWLMLYLQIRPALYVTKLAGGQGSCPKSAISWCSPRQIYLHINSMSTPKQRLVACFGSIFNSSQFSQFLAEKQQQGAEC